MVDENLSVLENEFCRKDNRIDSNCFSIISSGDFVIYLINLQSQLIHQLKSNIDAVTFKTENIIKIMFIEDLIRNQLFSGRFTNINSV